MNSNDPSSLDDAELDALFRAVRSDVPDTGRVEFAFETRLMSRLREQRSTSVFAWAWRLTPFFAAIVVAFGIWNRASTSHLEATASLVADAIRHHPDRILLSLVPRDR